MNFLGLGYLQFFLSLQILEVKIISLPLSYTVHIFFAAAAAAYITIKSGVIITFAKEIMT